MSDEDRALTGLARRRRDPQPSETGFEDIPTPPPIVVDDDGRQIARSRHQSPHPDLARDKKTIQELTEELWPARRALDLALEGNTRIAVLEARMDEHDSNGPVATIKAQMIHMEETFERDLEDHRKLINTVEDRALKADRFVRRVIMGALGTIAGSVIAAAVLIYNAGARSVETRAESQQQRAEVLNKIESLDDSLTDLKGQVRLLLRARIEKDAPQ